MTPTRGVALILSMALLSACGSTVHVEETRQAAPGSLTQAGNEFAGAHSPGATPTPVDDAFGSSVPALAVALGEVERRRGG